MLKGMSAIITGSTSGMGLAIAKALAKEGVNITLNGFADEARLSEIENEISAFGVRMAYSPADLGNIDEVDALIDTAMRAFSTIDIVVNSSGFHGLAANEEFPLDKWDTVMAANLHSVYYLTKKVLPIMQLKGCGRIVNVSCIHGAECSLNKMAYAAAMHGVIGMTKVTAQETATSGITCNAITSDLGGGHTAHEERSIKPADVGSLVVHLCSDAGAAISGVSYAIMG